MIKEQLTLWKIPLLIGNIADVDNAQLVKTALENQNRRLNDDPTTSHYEDSEMPMSQHLETVFDTMTKEITDVSGNQLMRKTHWAHIQWHNQSCTLHSHPGYLVSAVYYPQVPKDSNSPIVFQWDTGFGGHDRSWFLPNNGDYYAFPSHLQHFVTRNESQSPRISISINFIDNQGPVGYV